MAILARLRYVKCPYFPRQVYPRKYPFYATSCIDLILVDEIESIPNRYSSTTTTTKMPSPGPQIQRWISLDNADPTKILVVRSFRRVNPWQELSLCTYQGGSTRCFIPIQVARLSIGTFYEAIRSCTSSSQTHARNQREISIETKELFSL